MQFGGASLAKQLAFGEEAREKLINGIDQLNSAVSSTLGAGGRTVVIEDDFGNPHVTKDGVTVANGVFLEDEIENLGCTMLKSASRNTSSKAGDGTTTSTVLAHSLIHNYDTMNDGLNFRDIRKGIEDATEYVINQLDRRAVKIDDKRLENVSVISANNDVALGKLIADAYRAAGDNGVVTHQPSKTTETYVDVVEGTHLDGTPESHHFFTNAEKEMCELDKPLIFLCTSNIPNVRRIQNILEHAIKQNRSILLIAPLEAQPMAALAMNKVKGNIKVNVISPPSFGLKRKDILDDIALLTGAKVVNEDLGDALDAVGPDVLGSALKAISDSDGTTLAFNEKPAEVLERIQYLRDLLDSEDHHVMTRHLEKRLSILSGGVAIINVGGETEVEQKERIDRVDDAVHAVRAAKKEGILPGGGSALHFITHTYTGLVGTDAIQKGWHILLQTLYSPFNKILENAGLNPMKKEYDISKWGYGVDVTDGKVKDMRKAGIIDPLLVTKSALKNAVSVALTILSTDAVISNIREK